ncbi:MAG TPA: valine--tRNA ligase [Candidatus Angelobacter sp.]|nr:valine--tRNA ligase [Candidatus Angelobacter sp.]
MEIPKAYEPQAVEDKWYQFWQQNSCFTANAKSIKPPFSIVIPPPNVTGMLHMGHVLNNTIQDILSRKARMSGKEVLWLPGTDHAGIATQVQVEKALKKEERKTKYDLGREEFLKRVWAWKEKHGGIIINQLKKLGCSCDWTRERFTMDPEYSRCVQKVFVDLYKKGLIYRGKRMVNWCPVSQTALSDEEVEMKPQKGFMYHFKVQVADTGSAGVSPASSSTKTAALPGKDGKIWLTIATTRPETIPGDTAVAVNPKDPRYAHLIGKHVIRPLPVHLPTEKKLIPIIGDEHVDFEFGTGVLKVTPAHDKDDFEIGQRHSLPIVDIMNSNGTMNDLAGESLAGLDRFEARDVAVERLKELDVLVKEDPYEHNVGFSQRADVPIEPRLSEQWFLKYPAVEQSKGCVEQSDEKGSAPASGAAARALAGSTERVTSSTGTDSFERPDAPDEASAAAPGAGAPPKMHFHPQRWAKVYDHWLTNIQDWCISRQLWWGHRIPVWYWRGSDAALPPTFHHIDKVELKNDAEHEQIMAITADEAAAKELEQFGFTQDPDVLDTWFSSWLWPFATMGWPEQTETLKKFYPTTDLVTGPDIIFFWVARMIMAGYEFMGDMPFRNVYFTGIIRDKQGRKMSKTLGNSPDPLHLIASYGADALRFGTMRSAPLGQDVLFDEKDVELGRNFCNKLWNACRFRQMQGSAAASAAGEGAPPEQFPIQGEINPQLLSSDDKWILLKLNAAIAEITEALNAYNFSTAVQALYRFFWSEYCDWYVEASKAVLHGSNAARKANTLAVIDFILSHTLRLFHPFLPFITEELWHGMGYAEDMPADQGGKTIMYAPWPKPLDEDFKGHYGLDDCYLDMVNAKYDLVTQGRNLRRAGNISASKKVKYIFKPVNFTAPQDLDVIKLLLNAEALEVNENYQAAKGTPAVRAELGELFLPLEGLVDVAAEKIRLGKEREKLQGDIEKTEQKLANPNFVQKVPPQVLAEHQQRAIDLKAKLEHVLEALKALER